MNKLSHIILLVGIVCAPVAVLGKDLQTPAVTIKGNAIRIDGQFAHIQGEMPSERGPWFYHVEQRTTNLFVYSFWTINEFQDTKEKNYGLYEAKSWTVEVLDSKDDPETELIFDRSNDFLFWGNLVMGADQAQVMIDSIKGMPKSSYGPVTLKILQ